MTFAVKFRGAGGRARAEYRCPIHGVFEAELERDANGDPPARALCPLPAIGTATIDCLQESPWTITEAPAQGTRYASFTRGKIEAPSHPMAMDTRDLGEGMPLQEWKAKRAKQWRDWDHKQAKDER